MDANEREWEDGILFVCMGVLSRLENNFRLGRRCFAELREDLALHLVVGDAFDAF